MIPRRFQSLIVSSTQFFILLFGLLLCCCQVPPSSSSLFVWVSAFQQQPQSPLPVSLLSSCSNRHNHKSIFICRNNNGILEASRRRHALLLLQQDNNNIENDDNLLSTTSSKKVDVDAIVNNNKSNIQIRWIPYSITVKNVCYSYPDTYSMWRKLTSSVPRRTLAIDNLSVEFPSGIFQLIVGASSSGKSTLLQLILGVGATANEMKQRQQGIQPDSGIVELVAAVSSCDNTNDGKSPASAAAVSLPCPILLDQKPSPFDYKNIKNPRTTTIQQLLGKTIEDTFKSQIGSFDVELVPIVQRCLLGEINEIFQFASSSSTSSSTSLSTTKLIKDKTLDQLSPSENYILALAIATIESSLGSSGGEIRLLTDGHHQEDDDEQQEEQQQQQSSSLLLELPSPILLLDEWMDTETSVIVRNVQKHGIERLLQHTTNNGCGGGGGGIVLSVTHKPQLYSTTATTTSTTSTPTTTNSSTGPITFCRGTILPSSSSYAK